MEAKRTPTPDRVLLLTLARTASHLVERVLAQQPDTFLIAHPFLKARLGGHQNILTKLAAKQDVTDEDRQTLKMLYSACFTELAEKLKAVEIEGKRALIHEHISFIMDPSFLPQFLKLSPSETAVSQFWNVSDVPRTNPLVIPDALLSTGTVSVLPIRHPAISFASSYRTSIQALKIPPESPLLNYILNIAPLKLAYDWLEQHAEHKPIVIDVDDIIDPDEARRAAFMIRLCDVTGFDPKAFKFEWEAVSAEQRSKLHPMAAHMLSTLHASTGLRFDKSARNLVLEDEVAKWKGEFGGEGAERVKVAVLDALPDYEYLFQRRLTA